MVSSLTHLTSLTISSPDRVAHTWRLWKCIESLPYLEYLSMKFPDAEECLLFPLFAGPEKDSPLSLNPDAPSSQPSAWNLRDLASTLPRLQSLTLASTKAPFLQNHHLGLLPQSLTSLELVNTTNLTFDCFGHLILLPRISTLKIRIFNPTSVALSQRTDIVLPPTITDLLIFHHRPIDIPAFFWNGARIISADVRMLGESYRHLPSTVETLQNFRYSGYQPHLRSLKVLSVHEIEGGMLSWPLDDLPPSLERLTLFINNKIEKEVFKRLSASLKTLIIPYSTNSLNDTCTLLKDLSSCSGITKLKLPWIELDPPSCVDDDRPLFPPNLKKLQLDYGRLGPFDVTFASLLPRGLTCLKLFAYSSLSCTGFLSPASLGMLPPSLTVLRCGISLDQDSENFTGLPKGLRIVDVRYTSQSPSKSLNFQAELFKAFAMLPLQTLKIRNDTPIPYSLETLRLFPSDLYRLWLQVGLTLPGSFAALPRGLRHLDMELPSESRISGDEFKDLPRNLATLQLQGAFKASRDDIACLPPYLISVNLRPTDRTALSDPSAVEVIPKYCSFSGTERSALDEKIQDCWVIEERKTFQDPAGRLD